MAPLSSAAPCLRASLCMVAAAPGGAYDAQKVWQS
jgi:hypothetical protein